MNNNRIKFEGKTIAKVNINGKRKHLEILISTKKSNPLLSKPRNQDPDIKLLKRQFKNLFNENHTVKGIKVEIQLKEDAKLIQPKRRPIPIHLQQSFEKEIEKLKSQVHIEKANDIDENCLSVWRSLPVKTTNR